jgi:fatty acid-binding protein DegV
MLALSDEGAYFFLIESVYSSFKQRTKAFFNVITANPLNKSERLKRSLLCLELFIRL